MRPARASVHRTVDRRSAGDEDVGTLGLIRTGHLGEDVSRDGLEGVEDALDLNWSVLAQQVPVEAHEHREPGEHISGKSRKDVPIEFVELLDAVEGPTVLQGDLDVRNTNRAAENVRVPESRFLELYPDNDACLEYLRGKFFPDGSDCPGCGKPTKFFRIKSRAAYSCMYCRKQVYPTAGTIFHKSTVNLQLWFYAIYLMSSTRCGISAKQLGREIGVSYKTAHRMFKQIRTLLSDESDPDTLTGPVEMDETYMGGKRRGTKPGRPQASSHKVPVFGMVERRGKIVAKVVPNVQGSTLRPHVQRRVLPGTMIYTDEYQIYDRLRGDGYQDRRVHHAAKIYVDGDVHTNTIEGFFGLLKNGIRGVYHSVSSAYLQNYLDEYAFRYNHRNSGVPMFDAMLSRVQKPALAARQLDQ